MGGARSGPPPGLARPDLVEDRLAVDVNTLHRQGLLLPGRHVWIWPEAPCVGIEVIAAYDRIELRRNDEVMAEVEITTTGCHYGGVRPWFRCPALDCQKRVAKLCWTPPSRWSCRRCAKLYYASQFEDAVSRRLRRARRIRERLGQPQPTLLLWPFPPRPSRMRRATYERLKAEVMAAEQAMVDWCAAFVASAAARADKFAHQASRH